MFTVLISMILLHKILNLHNNLQAFFNPTDMQRENEDNAKAKKCGWESPTIQPSHNAEKS